MHNIINVLQDGKLGSLRIVTLSVLFLLLYAIFLREPHYYPERTKICRLSYVSISSLIFSHIHTFSQRMGFMEHRHALKTMCMVDLMECTSSALFIIPVSGFIPVRYETTG